MNIVIIEDEEPALARIRKLVKEVDPLLNIVGTADSIDSAVSLFRQNPGVDLALMDIELADGQSFEIFNRVEVLCPVIFTTAYDEFALKAFKVNSVDYLLKPIEFDELKRAVGKFRRLNHNRNTIDYNQQIQTLLSTLKPNQTSYKSRFLVKVGTKMISIPVDQIAYFHASDKVVYIQVISGQKHIVDYTLEELMQMLDGSLFFQLNRQFIVNIKGIQSVHTYFNGKLKVELRPTFSEDVIVSRERANEFKSWLNA